VRHKAAIWMAGYALVLIDGGVSAYFIAPPEANAATALIIPSACAVLMLLCAVASAMMQRNRLIGMIGVHAGLILPLVFAIAFGSRALVATSATEDYREQQGALVDAEAPRIPGANASIEAETDAVDHDKMYLAVTLWRLTGLSGLAFVAILLQRPKPEARAEASVAD